eukprot:PhM_4_TR269/c0_g1_i1/m.1599
MLYLFVLLFTFFQKICESSIIIFGFFVLLLFLGSLLGGLLGALLFKRLALCLGLRGVHANTRGGLGAEVVDLRHGLRDGKERQRRHGVDNVVPAALDLQLVTLLEQPHDRLADELLRELGVAVHDLVEVGLLGVGLLHGEDVVELNASDGDLRRRRRQPRELVLGLLDVALEVELGGAAHGLAVRALLDVRDESVAPVHECDLLVVLEQRNVGRLEVDLVAVVDGLRAERLVLLVAEAGGLVGACAALDGAADVGCLRDGGVAGDAGVEDLRVEGPQLVPLHDVDDLGHALDLDELAQRLRVQTLAGERAHRGEAGVVPAVDGTVVHKLRQLALRHDRELHVEAAVVVELGLADAKSVDKPEVLLVAVAVLSRAERVRDALDAVDDGAREVVRGVHVVLATGAAVREQHDTVHGGVAHRAVEGLDVDLGADTALLALLRAFDHLLPELEVLLHGVAAARRGLLLFAKAAHFLHGREVDVRLASLEQLAAHRHHLLEVVRRERGTDVGLDAEPLQVLLDGVLEGLLLLGGVRVVEAEDHLALVLVAEHGVDERGLGVANVHETAGLGRETRHHLALRCVLELKLSFHLVNLGGGRLLRLRGLLGLGLLRGRGLLHEVEPARKVGVLLR